MKKILTSILVLAFLTLGNVFNATSQTISSANFPIGGFDIGTLSGLQTNTLTGHSILYDSLQNIGFNTLFHVGFYEWHLQFASQSPSLMSSYFGADGYDQDANGNGALDHFYFGGKGVTPAAELRYFLACDWGNPLSGNAETEDTVFDAERIDLRAWINHHGTNGNLTPDENSAANSAWQTLTFNGSIPGPKLRLPDEWTIPPAANTTEVLRLEITDFVNVPSQAHSPLEYLRDDPTNSNKIFTDFIFRFDRSASGILYTLTITAEDGNGAPVNVNNGGQIIQTISYSDYTGNKQSMNSNLYNNPRTLYNFQSQNYAVLTIGNGTDGLNIAGASKVDFALTSATSANQIPIIVRGLRVRSKMANDILTGAKDFPAAGQSVLDLYSIFHDIYYGKANGQYGMLDPNDLYHSGNQPAPIQKMPNIHAGGEPEFPNFRVIAYVDQRFRKFPASLQDYRLGKPKNILPFLQENTGTVNVRFRSIYEDQAGVNTPPAIIMSEGKWNAYQKFAVDNTPFVPRDGISNIIRNPTDGSTYNDLGFTLEPANGSTDLSGGYTAYTSNRQARNDGTADDHMCSAMAANPIGRVSTKWYSLLPTTVQLPLLGSAKSLDQIVTVRTDIATRIKNKQTIPSYLLTDIVPTITGNPGTFPDVTHTRAPLMAEMRYDAWDAIAHGAKGIFFNEIGSDHDDNIGICESDMRANYDSWLGPDPSTPLKLPIVQGVQLGDGTTHVLTDDPTSTEAWNFDSHLIKYTGNLSNLTNSMGTWTPNKYQWIPIGAASDESAPSIQTWLANNTLNKVYEGSNSHSANAPMHLLPNDGNWVAYKYPVYKSNYTCTNDNSDHWAAFFDTYSTDGNYIHYDDPGWRGIDAIIVQASGLYSGVYYPFACVGVGGWIPWFYGFKERWNGARQIVKDLGYCANTLMFLNWINSYSLPQISLADQLRIDNNTTFRPDIDRNSGINFDNQSPFLHSTIFSQKLNRTSFPVIPVGTIRTGIHPANGELDPEDLDDLDHFRTIGGSNYRIDDSKVSVDYPNSAVLTDDRRLFELGFFSIRQVPYTNIKFVTVVNKRTWPYYYTYTTGGVRNGIQTNDGTGANSMLGAIDVRMFSAKVDLDLANKNSPNFKWKGLTQYFLGHPMFAITDYRDYCHPQFRTPSQFFNIQLDPGEGTLLSIEPFIASHLAGTPCSGIGPTGHMGVAHPNNGRPISAMESGPTSQSYQMTYTEGGSVAVCYPVEGIQTGDSSFALRNPGTPADSLIDSNTNCLHPVIAAHPETPRQLALAYSQDSSGTGAHPDSTSVIFRFANYSTPYAYSSYIVLDKFKTVSNYTTATPAVTPAKTGCGKWWVSWRNPATGGHIALLDTSGNIISQKTFSAGDITTTRFVSITSHLWRDTSGASETDTCYMAFEEGPRQMGATIYFLKAYCNGSGGVDTSGLLNISAGLPYCENHYPNISMTATRGVMITWEAVMPHFTYSDSVFTLHRQHYAILHGRYPDGIRWTTYLSLKGFEAIVDHNIDDTLSMLPVTTVADYDAARINDTVWNDRCRLVFNDPVNEQVHISHYGWMNGNFIPCFQNVAMPDASLWPSSPERKASNGVLQPLMYTHPTYAADTIYSPVVTIYDFPISTLINVPVLKQEIVAKPQMATCGLAVQGEVGQIVIHRDTNTYIQTWQQRDTVLRDTTIPPFNWADSSIHSQQFTIQAGDTLQYPRYFRVGQYDPGDTSEVTSYLNGSSDYVMMKVNMRSATNHAVLYTIDSCELYSGGFMQSGSFADGGISKTGFTSSITGNVYLTFEVSRGNPANTFQVSNTEVYDDTSTIDYLPGPPGADTSFKKSPPHAPQTTAYVSQITMTVHPNPFRTQTSIELEVPKEVMMNVSVFDVLGRQVTNLFSNYSDHNNYNFTLDSKQLNPGMYYVRVQCGGEVVTRKIELLK
jgi:hypothetical protein